MSAGLEVAYSALSAQASYWRERQNQFPLADSRGPEGKQKGSQEERLRDSSSIRRAYPSLHCGSCSLLSFWKFLTAHTFMDISTTLRMPAPPPPRNQFPPITHQALGLFSVRFGADKQTDGARWRGLSWCRARRW